MSMLKPREDKPFDDPQPGTERVNSVETFI